MLVYFLQPVTIDYNIRLSTLLKNNAESHHPNLDRAGLFMADICGSHQVIHAARVTLVQMRREAWDRALTSAQSEK